MQNESQPTNSENATNRWTLIRDIAVLQVKLIVDGLRDLVLVPVSLVAGIVSLVKSDTGSKNEFYGLLRLGKQSEHWINLFGAAEQFPDGKLDRANFPNADIDVMVSRIESFVVDEYKKGGVTRQAKERIDKAIASLHKLASGKNSDESSGA